MPLDNIFVLPVLDQYLLYAPLQGLAVLLNAAAVRFVSNCLLTGSGEAPGRVGEVVAELSSGRGSPPQPRQGPLRPAYLGLLPTRGCNLACRYCGFVPRERRTQVMDLELARDAIDWYLDLVRERGERTAEIHFFGGEPFHAPQVVEFCVQYARTRALDVGIGVRFEVATNGVFDQSRARWLAETFDDVIVSLDGPAEIQNHYRPGRGGQETYESVVRTAEIVSDGPAALALRVCVTADTVARMPEIAAWLCEAFRPAAVCFEPVRPVPGTHSLAPPDPWCFARRFVQAAAILEASEVKPVYATADIGTRRVSFCPVGSDVVIVSPGGTLSTCYLLRDEWEARGLDLEIGYMKGGTAHVDGDRLATTRALNVWNKPACRTCFCQWHCAGGCHVYNELPRRPGDYGRLCVQTRAIALRNILTTMEECECAAALFDSQSALMAAVSQHSDAISDARWSG
ncbi:MAG: radical SAM protein [Anaerolineae bacterium]|nr:radical SAM protein [Anaerolineae bacterium]